MTVRNPTTLRLLPAYLLVTVSIQCGKVSHDVAAGVMSDSLALPLTHSLPSDSSIAGM
jgi:hypothetical protein